MIPPVPEGWTHRRYRRWVQREFGLDLAILILDRDGPTCWSRRSWEHGRQLILSRVYAYLGGNNDPAADTLDVAISTIAPADTQAHHERLVKEYRQRYGEDDETLRNMSRVRRPHLIAAAGRPEIYGPAFRSQWERRLSLALTRLGIRWDYEPDQFHYRDWNNRGRRYTPDFRLIDFKDTYVEVKGPAGADAADQDKMAKVVRAYPNMTLLLWDADRVEYIEDVDDPMVVVGLLRTTRLNAA